MTARDRVRGVRSVLIAGVALRAAVWGLAAALSLEGAAALIDQQTPLSVRTRTTLLALAVIAGCIIAAALWWRDRAVLSERRVALWIEEHQPGLEYRLVTAIESGIDGLLPLAALPDWRAWTARRTARTLGLPMVLVAIAVSLFLALPTGAVARMRAPRAGDALSVTHAPGARRGARITPLVADLAPPAYSRERPRTIDEPTDIRSLVGTMVTLRGSGPAAGLLVLAATETLVVAQEGAQWRARFRIGEKPIGVRLRDGDADRLVAIEPVADSPPTVTLGSPARDSVVRAARGRITLAAEATDDHGIAAAWFEFIVSSGEGESFTFKSGVLGTVRNPGRRATLAATISLDSLALKPGDIVHLRAVARDENDASGPGTGTSETRAIRIARPDEYDSVAVDAAPPGDAEKSVISERMLIMLAEALQAKRPSLKREAVVSDSRAIAADQKKLRRSVGEIVFSRLGGEPGGEEQTGDDNPGRAKSMEELLARADSATNAVGGVTDFEGGESPVVAVNKPLLEAYNAMWDASGELEIGEPGRALPHMRRALAAIQRARQAERLYLRGRPPQVVVDIGKARLQAKDKGSSSVRRLPAGSRDAGDRLRRFAMIVELAARDGAAAADSLLLLRIDALDDNTAFASALGDAAAALRGARAKDAANALARARRAVAGPVARRDSLSRWSTIP